MKTRAYISLFIVINCLSVDAYEVRNHEQSISYGKVINVTGCKIRVSERSHCEFIGEYVVTRKNVKKIWQTIDNEVVGGSISKIVSYHATPLEHRFNLFGNCFFDNTLQLKREEAKKRCDTKQVQYKELIRQQDDSYVD